MYSRKWSYYLDGSAYATASRSDCCWAWLVKPERPPKAEADPSPKVKLQKPAKPRKSKSCMAAKAKAKPPKPQEPEQTPLGAAMELAWTKAPLELKREFGFNQPGSEFSVHLPFLRLVAEPANDTPTFPRVLFRRRAPWDDEKKEAKLRVVQTFAST